jgi:hypothetical protein
LAHDDCAAGRLLLSGWLGRSHRQIAALQIGLI